MTQTSKRGFETFRSSSVLVTGHTGFKGSWLCHWLDLLGAEVHGLGLDPHAGPTAFESTDVKDFLASDARFDVCDRDRVMSHVSDISPRIVMHLAAQPLVRASYRTPWATFSTNALGTATILDAITNVDSVQAVVVVTTDKVYKNQEMWSAYREEDELGGKDPYSASKACAEIITDSYRSSFFERFSSCGVATARAGNVIGGGDWSEDRLIPDALRAIEEQRSLEIRNPNSTRPWQHVLDPIHGYLLLAESLLRPGGSAMAQAWNFGPNIDGNSSVKEVIALLSSMTGLSYAEVGEVGAARTPESSLLALDNGKARALLDWRPTLNLSESIRWTVDWHSAWLRGSDMHSFTREQIRSFSARVTSS